MYTNPDQFLPMSKKVYITSNLLSQQTPKTSLTYERKYQSLLSPSQTNNLSGKNSFVDTKPKIQTKMKNSTGKTTNSFAELSRKPMDQKTPENRIPEYQRQKTINTHTIGIQKKTTYPSKVEQNKQPLVYKSFSPQLVEQITEGNNRVVKLQFKNELTAYQIDTSPRICSKGTLEPTSAIELGTNKIYITGPRINKQQQIKMKPTSGIATRGSYSDASPQVLPKNKIQLNEQTQSLSNQVMSMISNMRKSGKQ